MLAINDFEDALFAEGVAALSQVRILEDIEADRTLALLLQQLLHVYFDLSSLLYHQLFI